MQPGAKRSRLPLLTLLKASSRGPRCTRHGNSRGAGTCPPEAVGREGNLWVRREQGTSRRGFRHLRETRDRWRRASFVSWTGSHVGGRARGQDRHCPRIPHPALPRAAGRHALPSQAQSDPPRVHLDRPAGTQATEAASSVSLRTRAWCGVSVQLPTGPWSACKVSSTLSICDKGLNPGP